MGEFAYTALVFCIGAACGAIGIAGLMLFCEVRDTRKKQRP